MPGVPEDLLTINQADPHNSTMIIVAIVIAILGFLSTVSARSGRAVSRRRYEVCKFLDCPRALLFSELSHISCSGKKPQLTTKLFSSFSFCRMNIKRSTRANLLVFGRVLIHLMEPPSCIPFHAKIERIAVSVPMTRSAVIVQL